MPLPVQTHIAICLCPFVYVLTTADFPRCQQSWVIATQALQSHKTANLVLPSRSLPILDKSVKPKASFNFYLLRGIFVTTENMPILPSLCPNRLYAKFTGLIDPTFCNLKLTSYKWASLQEALCNSIQGMVGSSRLSHASQLSMTGIVATRHPRLKFPCRCWISIISFVFFDILKSFIAQY